jgi:hypothetical protein
MPQAATPVMGALWPWLGMFVHFSGLFRAVLFPIHGIGAPVRVAVPPFTINELLILPLASRITAKLTVKLSLVPFGLTACPRQ